ncbi:MAG TPA: 50S ribosomal protein L18 [Lentisphaeria bacterium]|nr:MAG: 50S ribosomal protein L18 [Lentisphaerae bacterium GWF2_38_69]HBM16292.1 50S ribosomal protein L18 [Lentisphaeria bacterium]
MGKLNKVEARQRRHMRLRQKIAGTADRPRMAVFASCKHIYVQFIDDNAGKTIASASTNTEEFKKTGEKVNAKGAEVLGTIAAAAAKAAGISEVVFDRGGFSFHGKLKALADSARKSGLKI